MTYKDVFGLATYESGVRICDVADLDNLEVKLVDNHKNCKSNITYICKAAKPACLTAHHQKYKRYYQNHSENRKLIR